MNIEIESLNFSYENGPNILNQLSVKFDSGFIYGILAPNGSGKTTLINIIMGFLQADSGEIAFSENLSLKDISLVEGGDKNLYMKNTAKENVYFFSIIKGLKEDEIRRNIDKYKKFFYSYDKIKDKLCETLSHGQKRMLAIFIALVSNSKVLILDESTEGLDMENIQILEDLLLSVHKDKIIIIVSHDYNFVDKISSFIYYLKDGKLLLGSKDLRLEENYNNIFKKGYGHD